jgi:lipoprotein-anchoring transpeptidase ErfK/SrfK
MRYSRPQSAKVAVAVSVVALFSTALGVNGLGLNGVADAATVPASSVRSSSIRSGSVVSQQKKPTRTLPNPCPSPKTQTTVAAMNNTKYGAPIKIYAEANDKKDPIYTLGVGIEVNGVPVFTVNAREGDWLNINIPRRPNGQIGWIKASDVHVFQHTYFIVIQLKERRLTLCNAGRVIQQEPVGVGDPSKGVTPTGNFYTLDLLRPKAGSPYGAYALGLSGFSEDPRIENFAGGEGRIGIHGTRNNSDVGKAISHGCVRMTNAAITKLVKTIPLGVPVSIVT